MNQKMYCLDCGGELPVTAVVCCYCQSPVRYYPPTSSLSVETVIRPPEMITLKANVNSNSTNPGKPFSQSFVRFAKLSVATFLMVVSITFALRMFNSANQLNPLDNSNLSIRNFSNPNNERQLKQTSENYSSVPKTKPTIDIRVNSVSNNDASTGYDCTIFSENKVNYRWGCDVTDCDSNAETIVGNLDNGTKVKMLDGGEVNSVYGYQWVQILIGRESYYIASSKLACEKGE